MKQRQNPCIQLVFAGRRRENRIPNYSELLSSLESTRMCLYMYHSPPDRGPTRLSLSCSFIPVAPPVFLVVMLELLHGVPLAIASSSLLLPISRGSVSHRQTLHQRPHEVQKARRLPLIEEFARQSACAATDISRTLAQAEKHRTHFSSTALSSMKGEVSIVQSVIEVQSAQFTRT